MYRMITLFSIILAFLIVPTVGATGYHPKPQPPKHHYPKPPSNNPSPPPVLPPPVGHDCTYTGAGKDGQPGNDDCAPLPVPPAPPVTSTPPPRVTPPPATTTNVVTVVKLVPAKPKIITKWKTKIVRVTVTRFVVCPKGYDAKKNRRGCQPSGKQLTG